MTRVFVAYYPRTLQYLSNVRKQPLSGDPNRDTDVTQLTQNLKFTQENSGSPSTHKECTISITPQKVLKQCAFQSYFRITQFFKVHNIKKNLLAQIPPLSRSLVWPSESTSVSLTAIPYISKEKIYFVYTFSLVSASPQCTANSSY